MDQKFNLLVNDDHGTAVQDIKEQQLLNKEAKKQTKALLKGEARAAFKKAAIGFTIGAAVTVGSYMLTKYGLLNYNYGLSMIGTFGVLGSVLLTGFLTTNSLEKYKENYFKPTYKAVKQDIRTEQKRQRAEYDALPKTERGTIATTPV